jgi:hypothetical protein
MLAHGDVPAEALDVVEPRDLPPRVVVHSITSVHCSFHDGRLRLAATGSSVQMFFLLRSVFLRRFGPLGVVLTAYDLWRRLPKHRRQQLIGYGRRRGAQVAARARPRPAGATDR